MMKKMLVIFALAMWLQGAQAAENLYEKNYKEQNARGLKSLLADPDTKMYVSNHSDKDNIDMLENGYDMMGSTGFEAGSITPEMALQHGKSIKADVVLVYSKYASKKSALSKIEAIKEAAKTTGEIDPAVMADDEQQYKYYASYWAKLPMPIVGLHVIKLKQTSDDGTATDVDGLKILAVIKDSPAFKAGLKRGDVLLSMGGVHLQKPEELSQVARKNQGRKVDIDYERDGQPAKTQTTLNGDK